MDVVPLHGNRTSEGVGLYVTDSGVGAITGPHSYVAPSIADFVWFR